ncbi:MAG TPA: Mbeg1-like protein [Cellulomonas sp.]
MTAAPETNHDDLMDLASRWAYASPDVGDKVDVNGTEFTVVHTRHDTATGLDAYTFRNPDTDELTVAFTGTESLDDWIADATLLTQWDPAQYQAAEHYVQEMAGRYGPIGTVCGNSLGGGLAAYVAARNPSITAVTVNPAPVPDSLVGAAAPNVYNYISRADVLHRLVVAGGLEDRIIGHQISFAGTSMGVDFIGANHIGSDRGDPDETPYDGSMAVPFSLFHPNRVLAAGRYGALVDITPENLRMMVEGLQRQRTDLLTVQETELVGVEAELREYGAGLSAREEAIRHLLHEVVGRRFASVRTLAGEIRDGIERTLCSPLISFPEPPLVLRAAWLLVHQDVKHAVAEMVTAVQEIGDFAVQEAVDAAWDRYRAVFSDESASLTQALADQSLALQDDLHLVDAKWERFLEGATTVADAVTQADQETAAAIASRSCAPHAVHATVGAWPTQVVHPLKDDTVKQFRQSYVDERQRIAGDLAVKVGAGLAAALGPASAKAAVLIVQLEILELCLGAAQGTLRVAAKVASYSPLALLTGTSDDLDRFQQAVRDLYDDVRSASDEWQQAIAQITTALDRVPEVVLTLGDYLEQSFFSDDQIETAYDAFLKCQNVVDCSETAFGEAGYQLDEHDASAIDALAGRADSLRRDLATVGDSLAEMVS